MAETTSSAAPHAIRLRLAWECEPLAEWLRDENDGCWCAGPLASSREPERIALPWRDDARHWLRCSQFCLRRYFNRPSGLDDASRVELAIDDLQFAFNAIPDGGHEPPRLEIRLNDECLQTLEASASAWREEITHRLRGRNALELIAHFPPPLEETSGVFALGEVRLEIR